MNKDYTIDLDKVTPGTWIYCNTEEKSEALVDQLEWADGDTNTYWEDDIPEIYYEINENKQISCCCDDVDYVGIVVKFADIVCDNTNYDTSAQEDMSVYEYATLAGRFCGTQECPTCPLSGVMCPDKTIPSIEELQKTVQVLREFQHPPKKPEEFTLYRAYDSSGNFIKHGLNQEELFAEGAFYVAANTVYGWREHVTD